MDGSTCSSGAKHSIQKALRELGLEASKSMLKEMNQMHTKKVFHPINPIKLASSVIILQEYFQDAD